MSDPIDTTRLLLDIREIVGDSRTGLDITQFKAILFMAANAIEQLHERIESERRKSALAEERVNTLLQSEIDDGR